MGIFAEVAVPVGVRKTFAYAVPSLFEGQIKCGARVIVPFGRKLLTGYVVGIQSESPRGDFRLRPIRELLDSQPIIPAGLVRIGIWVAERYFAPPGEVLRALFPVGSDVTGSQRIVLTPRAEGLLRGGLHPPSLAPQEELLLDVLLREGPTTVSRLVEVSGLRRADSWIESLAAAHWIETRTALRRPRVQAKTRLGIRRVDNDGQTKIQLKGAQARLFSLLRPGSPPLLLQEVLREAKCNAGVAHTLARNGLVEIVPIEMHRKPADLAEIVARSTHVLTPAQQAVFDALLGEIRRGQAVRCLLHGITGSGKTEVYLKIIAEVLKQGDTALLLVPEIGLTPMLSRIAVSHFPDQVALLHSGMSAGERFDQWNRIRAGEAPVVVGTRSAVFAPLEKLRLIIIDEEQDHSYKQDESPCYHAREVAWQRMLESDGVLLMGSATPSVETYYLAREEDQIRYLSLPERIEARPLAEVNVVDMAVEFQRHGRTTVISPALHVELQERLRRGEQSLVLLNRRGYARSLLCRSCGHTVTCPDCSVSMTYHQEEGRLICHYCGRESEPPSLCGNCGGQYIYYVGIGTEQLEEIVRKLLPHARVARMDRDTMRRKGALRKLLLEFSDGGVDILVGTQMIAKGHDFPNVTLVGVVGADAGLSFPDFRAAERTFQLLTQVAGRAGRGKTPGRVVIQSFYPEHYALQFARRQDYDGFFRREIDYRKLLGYPPIRSLIQILITDVNLVKAMRMGERIGDTLKACSANLQGESRTHVLGPATAPMEKLRGKYRVQLLIKSKKGKDGLSILRDAFAHLAEQKLPMRNIHVDVDPLSLL
ncbi:MAG TPA: primosomal protein N' [Acidobacteriota bacterium]|nr:primosomal protein N' [Acidobacteriota bacterium]